MVAPRARTTLILVHRRPLFDQWVAQLALFLGIDSRDIGRIGAGKRKPNGRLDVAMLQSLVRKGEVKDLVAGYGHVISDECHHASCVSFERVLAEVKARYITGLTATPQRRDGHHPIMYMQLGPQALRGRPKEPGGAAPIRAQAHCPGNRLRAWPRVAPRPPGSRRSTRHSLRTSGATTSYSTTSSKRLKKGGHRFC